LALPELLYEGFTTGALCRDEIHRPTFRFESGRGRRASGSDQRAVTRLHDTTGHGRDGTRTGEYDPVILAQFAEFPFQGLCVSGRPDLHHLPVKDSRAKCGKPTTQRTAGFFGACHDHTCSLE
jgi:hypothetical protein